MSNQTAQIEKLNSENYTVWAVQMKSLLITLDLWDSVEGASVTAGGDTNKRDMKALATIMLCVKPSEIIHIKDCKTATDAWNTLSGLYKRDAPARKVNLFKRLVRFKFGSSENFLPQLNEFCTIIDELKSINIEMPEDLLSILLLCSLPEELESFVVAIESRDMLPKLDALKAKILEEEQRQGEKTVSSIENVFNANSSREKDGGGMKSNQRKLDSKDFRGIKCFKCGNIGHIKSQCSSSSGSFTESFAMGIFEEQHCYDVKNEWILDSGASAHMCKDAKMFSKLEMKTKQIMLASGERIRAEGIGTIELKSRFDVNISLHDVWYVPKLYLNLVSVRKIVEAGYVVICYDRKAEVKTKENKILYAAEMKNGIFYVNFKINRQLEQEDYVGEFFYAVLKSGNEAGDSDNEYEYSVEGPKFQDAENLDVEYLVENEIKEIGEIGQSENMFLPIFELEMICTLK